MLRGSGDTAPHWGNSQKNSWIHWFQLLLQVFKVWVESEASSSFDSSFMMPMMMWMQQSEQRAREDREERLQVQQEREERYERESIRREELRLQNAINCQQHPFLTLLGECKAWYQQKFCLYRPPSKVSSVRKGLQKQGKQYQSISCNTARSLGYWYLEDPDWYRRHSMIRQSYVLSMK